MLSTSVEDAQGRFTDNSCPGISSDCAEYCAKDLSPLRAAHLLCCTYSYANTPVIPFDLIGTVSCAKECLRASQWRTHHHIRGGLAASWSSLGNPHLLLLSSCPASCPGHRAGPAHTQCAAACRHLGLPTRKSVIYRRACSQDRGSGCERQSYLCSLLGQVRSKPKPQMQSDFFSFF